MGAGSDAGLGTAIHGQLIDIVTGCFFYYKGAVGNGLLKELLCLFIDTVIIGIHILRELRFGTVYPQKGERLTANLLQSFPAVINIIGKCGNPLCQSGRRPDTFKGSYFRHNISSLVKVLFISNYKGENFGMSNNFS
jgi:hypothetical protein